MATKKKATRKKASAASPSLAPDPMAGVRCDGIALSVGAAGQEELAPMLVEAVVRRNLTGEWRIVRVNPQARDFELLPSRRIPVARAFDIVATLEGDRDVEWAEPILDTPGLEPPPDVALAIGVVTKKSMKSAAAPAHQACSLSSDWSLDECNVKAAWQHPLPSHGAGRRQGEGIVVGHPDTGYTRHPEINDPRLRVQDGFDFLDKDPDALDPLTGSFPGHGTGTASVIMSGVGGPGAPPHVTGVAPLASLVPLRVSGSVIHFQFSQVTHAIEFATKNGHHVISMSLGGPFPSKELSNAIDRAVASGVIVLAAAGNVWPFVTYPARYDQVIAVAATNCKHAKWGDSARGPDVDVSAPGESVWRANGKTGAVERSSGTSFAVATTAGVCALWLAHHGRDRLIAKYGAQNLASVFKEILVREGVNVPPNWDKGNMGSGIVDAVKVLAAALPTSVAAGGMKSVGANVPRPDTDFDDVMHYFPDQPRPKIRRNLAAMLNVADEELDVALRRFGAELKLHAAIDPEMRRAIVRGPVVAKAKGKAKAAAPGTSLSKGLRTQMGG